MHAKFQGDKEHYIGHFRVPKNLTFKHEAKCEAIDMKMIFNYYANKTHFDNKGFALSLVLKVRFFGTWKRHGDAKRNKRGQNEAAVAATFFLIAVSGLKKTSRITNQISRLRDIHDRDVVLEL